jgi:protein ImuB
MPDRAGLPAWAAERDAAPFALVESGARGIRLTAVDRRAEALGLRPGQALADARAAIPSLATQPAEPERDRAALEALALWAGRYGPRRNIEGGDGVWIDVTGVAHLFGGELQLIDDLVGRLARAGITARAGLADTAGAAFALARFATSARAPWRISAEDEARAALAALPVEGLELRPDTVVLLRRLGLRCIGQLYALPREVLAQRFRADAAVRGKRGAAAARREREALLIAGSVLARLDRALGRVPEPLVALEEPPQHVVRHALAEPLISAAGVMALAEKLAGDLARLLEVRCEGGTRFVLGLYRTDGSSHHIRLGASRPCREAAHLMTLAGERLAAVDAGFGIDAMTFACTQVEPLGASQIALGGASRASMEAAASALIDRLSVRLGAESVTCLQPAGSHIPERAERRVAMLSNQTKDPAAPAAPPRGARPPFLLPSPEPVTVMAEVPDGPPRQFTWRRLVRRVARAEGPERIEPEWWRAIGRAGASHLERPRDYYAIEDAAGGRYWLFRAGLYGREEEGPSSQASAPQWFVHGVFG